MALSWGQAACEVPWAGHGWAPSWVSILAAGWAGLALACCLGCLGFLQPWLSKGLCLSPGLQVTWGPVGGGGGLGSSAWEASVEQEPRALLGTPQAGQGVVVR